MDRRSFFRRSATVAAVATVAPRAFVEVMADPATSKPCVPVACPPIEEFEINAVTYVGEHFGAIVPNGGDIIVNGRTHVAMCAPMAPLYDLGMANTERRPVADSMPTFPLRRMT